MATRCIHLELLIGTKVYDSAGKFAGRVEEVHAEQRDATARVTEYILGTEGLLQRLSISDAAMFLLRWMGAHRSGRKTSLRVPWDKMDLSSPQHPRLRCTRESLRES